MTRSFPDVEYHIIYSAGASSVSATLVSFHTTTPTASSSTAKSTPPPSTLIEVKSVGFDSQIGGAELDRRLRNLFVDMFESKHGKKLKADPRAMTKLWKEAGRVKAVLSANSDSAVTIESLIDDIDFKTRIARTAFEEACADLDNKWAKPILDAIAGSGLKLVSFSNYCVQSLELTTFSGGYFERYPHRWGNAHTDDSSRSPGCRRRVRFEQLI